MENLPIYILNLERHKYKYDKMDEILKGLGIKHHQRFEGVEGNKLLQKEINKISSEWVSKYVKKSVIGCAYSYLKLWRHVIEKENNDGFVLTMEDGFIPGNNFYKRLEELMDFVTKNKEKFDYANLYNNEVLNIDDNIDVLKIGDEIELARFHSYGTKCCLSKISFLKKLLSKNLKIYKPIDSIILDVCDNTNCYIYLIKKNVFGNVDFSTSTISGQSPYLLHAIGSKIKTKGEYNLSRNILYSEILLNEYPISEKFIKLALTVGFIGGLFVKLEYFLCFLLFIFLFDFLYFKINKKNVFNSLMNVMFVFIGYYLGQKSKKFYNIFITNGKFANIYFKS